MTRYFDDALRDAFAAGAKHLENVSAKSEGYPPVFATTQDVLAFPEHLAAFNKWRREWSGIAAGDDVSTDCAVGVGGVPDSVERSVEEVRRSETGARVIPGRGVPAFPDEEYTCVDVSCRKYSERVSAHHRHMPHKKSKKKGKKK